MPLGIFISGTAAGIGAALAPQYAANVAVLSPTARPMRQHRYDGLAAPARSEPRELPG